MRGHIVTLGLAALAVVAVACGGGTGPSAQDATSPATGDTSSPTSPSASPTTDGADPGASPRDRVDQLFAFQAPRITGGTYDATQLAGRDVAIWFWAPW